MTVRSSEELRESHEFHFEDKSCAVFSTNGKNSTRKLPCLAFVADLARGYPMRELFSAMSRAKLAKGASERGCHFEQKRPSALEFRRYS